MPQSAFHISALPHRWSDLLCHFFYLFGESLPSQSIPLTGSFSMDNQEGDGKSHQDTENFPPLNLYFMTYQLVYTHAHTLILLHIYTPNPRIYYSYKVFYNIFPSGN